MPSFCYYFIISFLILGLCCPRNGESTTTTGRVSCKDERGEDVDWFYLYKLPKHYTPKKNTLDASNTSGLRYMFITSKNYENWSLSNETIDSHESMPGRTLTPLFADATVLMLAYNDAFPNGTTKMNRGHSKGLVATDGSAGIWLIHSVPKFPTIPTYDYPSSGHVYGQSFLCLSLAASQMDKVGEQLLYNEANVYYSRVPNDLGGRFPNVEKVVAKEKLRSEPFYKENDIVTIGGQVFKSFAKSTKFNKELYEDLVAPVLDVNLLVESWRNGGGNLASNCTKSDKVYNVAEIGEATLDVSFKTTSDHSKWAASQVTGFKLWRWRIGGSDEWICVGDINRQFEQRARGGGTVCQKNKKVTKLYRNLVKDFEPCSNN